MAMSKKRLLILFIGGAVMLVLGGVGIPVIDKVIRDKIKETVIIRNGSELWEVWHEPTIPIYLQFYMFNITNPIEVKAGFRPVVIQVGPYTYREHRKKFDIVFNNNGTVSYKQNRTFFFERDKSVGDPAVDLITTMNPPILAVIDAIQYQPMGIRALINDVLGLYNEDIFMTRRINETLFGYTDPSLKTLMKIQPSWFYTDYVGYFVNKNYTDDGVYTIFTGETDISKLGVIDVYNGSRSVNYWSTPWANMVNGSDGSIGPPFEHDTEMSPMFSTDICRSAFGNYQKDVTTKHDIKLRRFVGTPDQLANATANPDNIGFCTPKTNCLPSGLLNISNCMIVDYFHIPVVVSFPHFYMADPSVINSVGGMNPNAEEHETAVDVEPWTGLVLQARKRLQINMHVHKVDGVRMTANVPTVFMPIFWINESVVVDDDHATMLQRQLFAPMEIASVLEKVLMILGGCLILLSIAIYCQQSSKRNNHVGDQMPGPVPTIASGRRRRGGSTRRNQEGQDERSPLLNEPTVPPYSVPQDDTMHRSYDSNDPVYHEPYVETDT